MSTVKGLQKLTLPLKEHAEAETLKERFQLSWRQLFILGIKLIQYNTDKETFLSAVTYIRSRYPATPGRPRKVTDDARSE